MSKVCVARTASRARARCWLFLALPLLLSFTASLAQSTILTLPGPAVWLGTAEEVIVALGEDGTVTRLTPEGRQTLETNWQGSQLQLCNGRVLGVNTAGRLAWAGEDLSGPEVAIDGVPACLEDGRVLALSPGGKDLLLLSPRLDLLEQTHVDALPDAYIVLANVRGDAVLEVALLTEPTERYPHGVLGDGLEASSLSLFDSESLERISRYTLPESYVFEQRRVIPGEEGTLLATRASAETGAGVVRLEWRGSSLVPTEIAEPIGQGFRWLNLFAAHEGIAYAVHTPHIGGPLQRYDLTDLTVTEADLGVTNHVINTRNLELGTLVSSERPHSLVFPDLSLRELRWIRCTETCDVVQTLPLEGRVTSNTAHLTWQGQEAVVAADDTGRLYVWALAAD